MPKRLRLLDSKDAIHLRAAEGWLELGDYESAFDELEEIAAEARAHPHVLSMRYAIYAKAQRWNAAAEVASALTEMLPEEPANWINLAHATSRRPKDGISEARRILLVAQVKFPNEHLILFKLACYCSQLGKLREAEKWLKKAMAIDEKAVQELAVTDPEIQPLWDSMAGTIWKRE